MSKNPENLKVKQEVENQKTVPAVEAQPDSVVKAEKQVKENKKVNKADKQANLKKQNKKTDKKPNAFVRTGKFISKKTKELFSELKKVTWPTFAKVVKQTGIVIAFVIIFAVVLFGIDRLLSFLFDLLIA